MSRIALVGPGLGETHDPTRLIPGDPDALRADARSIEEVADTLATVPDGVGGVGGWVGHAAEAYARSSGAQRTAVLVAATALSTAATALRGHASTLEWAQGQARAAVRQYDAAARCVPTADAPINLGFWNQAGYQWSEFWHGAAEVVACIGRLGRDHSIVRLVVDPDGWTRSTTDLATGLVAAVQDPLQLGIAALTAGGGLAATRGAEATTDR